MDYSDLSKLKNIEFLVDKYYNSNNFYNTLEYFVNKISENPYDFFETLSNYFTKNDLFKRSLSKEDLYEQLYYFLKEYDKDLAETLISFDYLSYMKIRKPNKDFIKNINTINKEQIFEIIKDKEFKNKYLKEYINLSTKEIYKKINIFTFKINPITKEKKETHILFKNIKEDKVRMGYKFYII